MQGRQRSSFDDGWLGKEDSSSLAVGRRAWKKVFDLIKRKAAILQLGRTALGNVVHRRGTVARWSKLHIIPSDARELSASRHDIIVPQLITFPTAAARREDHHLAVGHGLRISQSEDSRRLKLRGKDLTAFPDMHCRDHKDQNTPGFQPAALGVRQEHPFRTFVSTFASSGSRPASLKAPER